METKINKDNLEKALGSESSSPENAMSREMEIGFHQGAINTLVKCDGKAGRRRRARSRG